MQTIVQSKEGTQASATGSGTLPGTKLAEPARLKSEPYNPYLAARREWDERYGDLLSRAKKANRLALVCAIIAAVETPAFVLMALRPPKVVVVAVNSAGQFLGSGSSDHSVPVTEDMKRSSLSEWVSNLRMVTPDGTSQREAIEKVYARISSGSSAQTVVSDFYRAKPPQTRAQSHTVHIVVQSVLATSEKTYQVDWTEITRDLQGKVLFQQRWKGAFTFVVSLSPPNNERLSRLNPIGLYITQASWSEVL